MTEDLQALTLGSGHFGTKVMKADPEEPQMDFPIKAESLSSLSSSDLEVEVEDEEKEEEPVQLRRTEAFKKPNPEDLLERPKIVYVNASPLLNMLPDLESAREEFDGEGGEGERQEDKHHSVMRNWLAALLVVAASRPGYEPAYTVSYIVSNKAGD